MLYWGFRKVMPLAGCVVNFQDVQMAVFDYADAHNGTLPDAAKWQDEVSPYYEKEIKRQGLNNQHMIKPLDPNGAWGCEQGDQQTGMAFNDDLSGKKLSSIKDPTFTALIFEIPNGSRNAHQKYEFAGTNGPKVFGNPRPWMVYYAARGMSNMGSKSEFSASTGSSDDNSDDSSSNSKDDSSGTDTGTDSSKKNSSTDEGSTAGAAKPDTGSN